MNIGFENIIYELPSTLVDVDTLVRQAGYDDDMIKRLHNGGLRRVPIEEIAPLSTMVKNAIKRLMVTMPELPERVHGIMIAHSVPILAPADKSFFNMSFEGLNMDNIPQIAVGGQPCAILHMAVQLACNWLKEASIDKGILLIGADKAYSVQDRIFFGSAMGDAVFAGLISRGSESNHILSSVSECDIIAYEGENSPPDKIAKFRELNPLYIRHAIDTCLQKGNLEWKDIALIVPHTPYLMIWDTMAELLRFPRERILTEYLHETGHMNSNDSFVHYARAVNECRIQKNEVALLINPGFGGTRGCTLIRR